MEPFTRRVSPHPKLSQPFPDIKGSGGHAREEHDYSGLKSITDVSRDELDGRTVIVRVDHQSDKLPRTAETFKHILQNGGKAIALTSVYRRTGDTESILSEDHEKAIVGLENAVGVKVHETTLANIRRELMDGGEGILMLNLIGKGQEVELGVSTLPEIGDVYVMDSLLLANRDDGLTKGLAETMKAAGKKAVAGTLLRSEIDHLVGKMEKLKDAKKPAALLLGGDEFDSKINMVDLLLGRGLLKPERGDKILVAGTLGGQKYLNEHHGIDYPIECSQKLKKFFSELEKQNMLVRMTDAIEEGGAIMDIGHKTRAEFSKVLAESGTVVMYGIPGIIENEEYGHGSRHIMQAITENTVAEKIILGATATKKFKEFLETEMTGETQPDTSRLWISTGGAQSYQLFLRKELRALRPLERKT